MNRRELLTLNLSYQGKEISELFVWNMYGNNNNEIGKRISPYLLGGLGLSFLQVSRSSNLNKSFFVNDPQVEAGVVADLQNAPPGMILILPVGAGIEYYLFEKVSLTAETIFRYTFTDYLDGFSLSANPEKKDFYQSYTVGLVYKFNKGGDNVECPVLKY